MATTMIRTPRGKTITLAAYLARVQAFAMRDRAHVCEQGHFDCAAWRNGPCENEVAAHASFYEEGAS